MRSKTSVILRSALRLALSLILLAGCAAKPTQPLSIKGGAIVGHLCDGGDTAQARYYALSDDSLHFVKVTLNGGRQYTLPNVVSASGARYSDGIALVWWTKGDTALVEVRELSGAWKTPYRACNKIPDSRR